MSFVLPFILSFDLFLFCFEYPARLDQLGFGLEKSFDVDSFIFVYFDFRSMAGWLPDVGANNRISDRGMCNLIKIFANCALCVSLISPHMVEISEKIYVSVSLFCIHVNDKKDLKRF